jgi:hypothetical protein
MTPKEKAVELYNKYEQLGKDFTRGVSMAEFAKQCALIAVDEILFTLKCDIICIDVERKSHVDLVKYWEEVKQEIEKL